MVELALSWSRMVMESLVDSLHIARGSRSNVVAEGESVISCLA
jgi:hypothetical protein